jgi:ribosomal protein S12 methylthiotransferase accessory factor
MDQLQSLPPTRPLIFERHKKAFIRDGGHRVVSPEATLERFGHHVSSITGAVSMLERISPAGDGTMHVYLAGHNLARRHRNLGQLRSDLRNMSAGKGTTDVQAKASGLCEGLERYSGVFRGDEPRIKARLMDLRESGIEVRDCLLFSDRQYREREATNACNSTYNFVPLPFDPAAEIDWSPLWSLTRRETRYLPTGFCYYDFPEQKSQRFCVACSNGCAAGNTLAEAVLQGFFELVERDSVALWWYNRVRRPGIDVDSFDEPYVKELRCSLANLGREMHVLDLTSDLGIPVFAAWSRRVGAGEEQIVLGFGAHLDARIALLRAITEMVQMMSHLHQNPIDGAATVDINDAETVHWLRTATAENQPYLNPDVLSHPRTAADFPATWSDDVVDDVAECQERVEEQGLEMLVLDQTRPEIGLPVVKVVVPGLRHFWARFAPGRLYDVPVRLSWMSRSVPEEKLNPIPMFL